MIINNQQLNYLFTTSKIFTKIRLDESDRMSGLGTVRSHIRSQIDQTRPRLWNSNQN